MARGTLQFLSGDDIGLIQEASTQLLEEVGVSIHSKGVVDLLLENGASLSKEHGRVLIPESMVREALARAPKSILLAARDRSQDIRLPVEGWVRVSNGGEGVFIKDMLTGETRAPTSEDVRDFAVLVDALPQLDFLWTMVGALDQPPDLKGLVELKLDLEYSTKHAMVGASDAAEARRMIELASLLTGGEDELAKRPIISSVQCPISPLTFEKGSIEAQVELSRAMIPVVSMSASVAGLTSPVTLAGTLAQVNAENLASLVVSQLARKGSPWIYSSDSAQGDLRTGSIDYGALETQLLRAGAAQIGRAYGLPTMTAGIGLESTTLDLGSAGEGVPHMALMSLVPSDLGSGLGGLDQAAGASFEQLVAEAWIWDLAREFSREFHADLAAIAFETIRDAALDGNFLGKRHTLTRFREESVASRKPEALLAGRGWGRPRGELLRRAKAEAERILRERAVPRVTKDEARALEGYVERFRKGL